MLLNRMWSRGPLCLSRRSIASQSICNRLAIIGGGKMAEAIVNALNTNKVQSLSQILVIDPSASRLAFLREKYIGIKTSEKYERIKGADLVILAVKPQHVSLVAESLPDDALSSSLLLSIVAGATIDTLRTKFKTDRLVRSMPNTPAAIMEGITV